MGMPDKIKNYLKQRGETTGGEILREFASGTRASRVMLALYGLELAGRIRSEERNQKIYYRLAV